MNRISAGDEHHPVRAFVTAEFTVEGESRLTTLGYTVGRAGWGATGQVLAPAAYRGGAAGAGLLVTEIEVVDTAVLDACPGLRAVATARGAPVNVDVDACTARGIPVLHTPGRNADSVADFTLGLILDLVRGITAAADHLRAGHWDVGDQLPYRHFRGPELAGRTLGLVGFGAVGRAVARRAEGGFGMRVIFHDPHVAGSTPLAELLADAHVVSLHCPRTPDTERLIRAETLATMRPGAFLVNTAGGACVDAADLVAALRAGRLAGAALDVYATEPLPADDVLRGALHAGVPRLLLTPHLAGAATDVVRRHTDMIVDDVLALHEGRAPAHCANPTVVIGEP